MRFVNSEILDVVNENDKIIGKKRRDEIHRDGDLHRVAHIWVFNSKGEILCQKRSSDAELRPDTWDLIVGGHVLTGGNYIDTAEEELMQEYGLKVEKQNLIPLFNVRHELVDGKLICRKFITALGLKLEDAMEKINFSRSEVSEIKFFSVDELQKIRKNNSSQFVTFEHFDTAIEIIQKILSGSARI